MRRVSRCEDRKGTGGEAVIADGLGGQGGGVI